MTNFVLGKYGTYKKWETNSIKSFKFSQDEYDALIFAQQWPNTYCIAVKDKKLDSCRLPTDKDIWTIHGIWPTKFGTYGPESCDATLKFDLNTLQPIKDQLERYWPTIEGLVNKCDLVQRIGKF